MNVLNKIVVQKADITKLSVDAIVNAANSSLLGGAGVDGCIHRAAGPDLLKECKTLGGCETGQSKITKGYKLPAKHIIHTVGPDCRFIEKDVAEELLKSCYTTCLELMKEHEPKTIAFCCISTGIYGYPNDNAAELAFKTVVEWMKCNPDVLDQVIFCTFLPKDLELYTNLMAEYESMVEEGEKEEFETTVPEKDESLPAQESAENEEQTEKEQLPTNEEKEDL